MRIGVTGLRGFPGVAGGIEVHCNHLYPKLAELRDQDQIVVCGRADYIGRTLFEPVPRVRVVPLVSLRSKHLEAISNTFVAIFVARFQYRVDLLHIHGIGPGLLAPLARLLGLKVVLTHHGEDYKREKWSRFAKLVLRLGERLGVGSANRTIVVSSNLAKQLRERYPRIAHRIRFIPNGADHVKTVSGTANALETFGLTKGDYIVSVGRLVPEKGFADLIEAHRASGRPEKLVIVGGKSNSDYDEELAALKDDTVILTGDQPQHVVVELVRSAKLFVLASYHEGMPIAALEAVALGVPLLLSDIPANVGVGLKKEHYFPVGDVGALMRCLRDGTSNIPAATLSDRFRWREVASATSREYDSLFGHPVAAE